MNAFDHLVRQVSQEMRDPITTQINAEAYEKFCKEFVFDALREVYFGKAFCDKFEVHDYLLQQFKSEPYAKMRIKDMGYISGTVRS